MSRPTSSGRSEALPRSPPTLSSPKTVRRSAADRKTNCGEKRMTLGIFWGSGSPFSWRVLLGAHIKGLEYESRLLEFSKGHLKAPEFLQMNPRGKVPVIRAD